MDDWGNVLNRAFQAVGELMLAGAMWLGGALMWTAAVGGNAVMNVIGMFATTGGNPIIAGVIVGYIALRAVGVI